MCRTGVPGTGSMFVPKIYKSGGTAEPVGLPGALTAHERICLVLLRSRSDTVRRIHCVRPGNPADPALPPDAETELIVEEAGGDVKPA